MKNSLKIFLSCTGAAIGSLVSGIIGLIIGATIGGNFGFPAFGGNVGYEAGGVFFAILGICSGSLLGILLVNKLLRIKGNYMFALFISLIVFIIDIVLFDHHMPPLRGVIIFLLPIITSMILVRWPRVSAANKDRLGVEA